MKRNLTLAAITAASLLFTTGTSVADEKAPAPKPKRVEPVKALPGAIAEGNNEFAISLYQELQKKPGNVFFSPYSISSALSMTYAGAKGGTQTQMAEVLHFWMPETQHHLSFQSLSTKLEKDATDNKYQLKIANKLWGEKKFEEAFLKSFLDLNQKYYGAPMASMAFQKDPDGSAKSINKWVSDKTNEKIKEIIGASIFKAPNPVAMILTNAIYFKSDWATKFEKSSTKSETFYLSLTETKKTDLMFQQANFSYTEDKSAQVLSMPYTGNKLEMVVILPKKKDGLADVEKALSTKQLNAWFGAMSSQDVLVKLPKFKLESDYALSKPLKEIGMKTAFTEAADFSGIADLAKLSKIQKEVSSLYISEVLHKGFVEVNEAGSEAAAVTAVIISVATDSVSTPPQPKAFTADHPFLFMIRDTENGAILFMGRVEKP